MTHRITLAWEEAANATGYELLATAIRPATGGTWSTYQQTKRPEATLEVPDFIADFDVEIRGRNRGPAKGPDTLVRLRRHGAVRNKAGGTVRVWVL